MKIYIHYLFFCLIIFAVCGGCNIGNANKPNLKETYSYKSNEAFDASFNYQLLKAAYPKTSIQVKDESIAKIAAWSGDTAALYISIAKKYYVDDANAEALLNFVYKGNSAFIAAGEIDSVLLNKIYCTQYTVINGFSDIPLEFTNTKLSLNSELCTYKDTAFEYYYLPMHNAFPLINDRHARVIGYNQNKATNFIVFFWGKGRLYLHAEPRAFSNYFLMSNKNHRYAIQVLQMLPQFPEHVYVDDYYNKRDYKSASNSPSFLNTLLKNPPLAWAFFIVLGLLLLYILINGKRRQQVIPIIKPTENSSVAYAEAIAGLYLRQDSNSSIAEKQIMYFNEGIRASYFITPSVHDASYLQLLSKKSGVPLEEITALYSFMETIKVTAKVTDEDLTLLNKKLASFQKKKQ